MIEQCKSAKLTKATLFTCEDAAPRDHRKDIRQKSAVSNMNRCKSHQQRQSAGNTLHHFSGKVKKMHRPEHHMTAPAYKA